jgi:hypothetical protein
MTHVGRDTVEIGLCSCLVLQSPDLRDPCAADEQTVTLRFAASRVTAPRIWFSEQCVPHTAETRGLVARFSADRGRRVWACIR